MSQKKKTGQLANSQLTVRKNRNVVLRSTYTISCTRQQEVTFWHETLNLKRTGQHSQMYIHFNSQVKAQIFLVEEILGME